MRIATAATAAALVQDGASVMIGGFMGVGTSHRTAAALVDRDVRDPTVTIEGNEDRLPQRA